MPEMHFGNIGSALSDVWHGISGTGGADKSLSFPGMFKDSWHNKTPIFGHHGPTYGDAFRGILLAGASGAANSELGGPFGDSGPGYGSLARWGGGLLNNLHNQGGGQGGQGGGGLAGLLGGGMGGMPGGMQGGPGGDYGTLIHPLPTPDPFQQGPDTSGLMALLANMPRQQGQQQFQNEGLGSSEGGLI
jgi:hypothetical protein